MPASSWFAEHLARMTDGELAQQLRTARIRSQADIRAAADETEAAERKAGWRLVFADIRVEAMRRRTERREAA